MKTKIIKEYALCIKCGETVYDRGQTMVGDFSGDGWLVYTCDNRACDRYGLLTTVSK